MYFAAKSILQKFKVLKREYFATCQIAYKFLTKMLMKIRTKCEKFVRQLLRDVTLETTNPQGVCRVFVTKSLKSICRGHAKCRPLRAKGMLRDVKGFTSLGRGKIS